MIYGLYQSAAGMMVNEYRQDVIANNIANAETVGFKRDLATFRERLPASEAGVREGPTHDLLDRLTGGLWLGESPIDFSEGTLRRTDQTLDLAIAGPGFFVVRQDGKDLLTRDGRLTVNGQGMLVAASDGAPVLGLGNAPIRVNRLGGVLTVDEHGRIEQDGVRRGRVQIRDVADYSQLRKAGASRFDAGAADSVLINRPRLMSGFVEDSGVEPVRETVNMIEASRAYQFNAQLITLQDQSVGRLLSTMANV